MPSRRVFSMLNNSIKESGKMIVSGKPVASKSKIKRIFEWQFTHILRNENPSSSQVVPSPSIPEESESSKLQDKNSKSNFIMIRTATDNFDSSGSFHEPSSVCLAEMVHDFMENEEKNPECGRARCNCSNGHCNVGGNADSEDDPKSAIGSGAVSEILKGLVQCSSAWERNLLADASKCLEAASQEAKSICKDKEECANGCLRRTVMNRLRSMAYNAAVCKSKWDTACGCPTGEYEYIDVIHEGVGKSERLIVDIDFRSQFEIARSTSHYDAVLHILPVIFVGKADRLQQITCIVCDAAKQSLKKKGLHIPPWRKAEYMRAKWLSPYKRTTNEVSHNSFSDVNREMTSIAVKGSGWGSRFTSEFELKFRSNNGGPRRPMKEVNGRGGDSNNIKEKRNADDQITVVVTEWQPPAVKPKAGQRGGKKIAAGLASMLREAGL
ncbi:hypothetical protein SUGI_0670490 [Cryptomeria japonica]|uniref:uncharacterized protein LOC131051899 n=1 Tax=Cryptomeria japonica TaxID=3369 RepID=UPI0024147D67|nr:uncharacterized protein LOC131051899 [Cryptomeria japonica]GLJ33329.1 hypothetical protein SUGI_0670490 [Cryptomeria japonica]